MLEIDIYIETGKKKRLWFNEAGVQLRGNILKKIADHREIECVKLDFKRVEVTDVSFAREAFVKLLSDLTLEMNRPQVLLINIDDYVRQNLSLSLKDHKKFALITNSQDEWDLIGKYSQLAKETIAALIEVEEATARELAHRLRIGITTCNNRLSNLYEMCAITRKEVGQKSGGVEYMYKVCT